MSYDLYVQARNKQLASSMDVFMEFHYRPWSQIDLDHRLEQVVKGWHLINIYPENTLHAALNMSLKQYEMWMVDPYGFYNKYPDYKPHSGGRCGDYISRPALEEGKETTITIWYSACEPERDYAFTLMRWIAFKIGKKAGFWKKKGLPSIPWFSYARCEAFPVIPEAVAASGVVPPELEWATEYDDLGCRTRPDEMARRHPESEFVIERAKWRQVIKEEIERLDRLWSEANVR